MQKRNQFLDIIKAFCVIFVIITHDSISTSFRLKTLFPFWIDMAVPMFMIISGYVYAISFERNKIAAIQDAYTLRFLMPKFIRYTIPFVAAFLVEVLGEVLFAILKFPRFSPKHLVVIFFQGGIGPGSYYYPILLQFLLFYPVIYFIIRKYDFKGLVLCFFINACFEFFQHVWGCNSEFYRMLLFRYTFVIAFGAWLYQGRDKIPFVWKVASFLVGTIFIVLYRYIKIKPRIITYWTGTSFLACLFLLPVAEFLIKKVHLSCKPIEFLGKASFNIFLAQMVYYAYMFEFTRKLISSHILQLCAHIAICVTSGIIFYFVEHKITARVLSLISKKIP